MSESYTLQELAQLAQAEIRNNSANSNDKITGVAPLHAAKSGELTYLIGGGYRKFLSQTQASAVLVKADDAAQCKVTALVVKNPEASFAKIAKLFDRHPAPKAGIHPKAIIGENCQIDPTASIGAGCVIEEGVSIGANTIIKPNTVIGVRTKIADDCIIYSNVTIYHDCIIGNRAIIHSGAVIGADGFGFTQEAGKWLKIPQIGRVVIGDDVEIGANTAIDRGAIADTTIKQGVKIDNFVQIGHNVEIGEHTIIAGCVGIAGSTKVGRYCMIGGACNLNGHITIADQVILTATTGVMSSIDKPGMYSAFIIAQPTREWFRILSCLNQLADITKTVKKLEKMSDVG